MVKLKKPRQYSRRSKSSKSKSLSWKPWLTTLLLAKTKIWKFVRFVVPSNLPSTLTRDLQCIWRESCTRATWRSGISWPNLRPEETETGLPVQGETKERLGPVLLKNKKTLISSTKEWFLVPESTAPEWTFLVAWARFLLLNSPSKRTKVTQPMSKVSVSRT
jgi:hypothetical protein